MITKMYLKSLKMCHFFGNKGKGIISLRDTNCDLGDGNSSCNVKSIKGAVLDFCKQADFAGHCVFRIN